MRSCPHSAFEGRKQNKIKKIISLNSFWLKKTALEARVTIHQFFHRNTSLQPAKTVSMKVAVRPRMKNNFSIFHLHFFFTFYS